MICKGSAYMVEYTIMIQYDKIDKIYVAQIPELSGCMAHGSTPEQALNEIKTALKLWLDIATKDGEKIPEPMSYVS